MNKSELTRVLLATTFLACSVGAHASTQILDLNTAWVEYDPATFVNIDGTNYTIYGDALDNNSFQLSIWTGHVSAVSVPSGNYPGTEYRTMDYAAAFIFTPKPGYKITGYELFSQVYAWSGRGSFAGVVHGTFFEGPIWQYFGPGAGIGISGALFAARDPVYDSECDCWYGAGAQAGIDVFAMRALTVPEPATWLLISAGLAFLCYRRSAQAS